MKLGGLTWWRNNYGSILQAYALQVKLNSYPGVQYEIINQYGKKIISIDNVVDKIKTLGIKATVKRGFWKVLFPSLRRRSINMQKFVDDNLKLSDKQYNEDNVHLLNEVYDGFICGSDQIWNPNLTKLESMYWLGFAEDNKLKIAYAPSIGVETIDNSEKQTIIHNLRSFNGISCRERTGKELLDRLLGDNKCRLVLDPTMLVDRKIWDDFHSEFKCDKPYIFVYLLRGTKEQRKTIEDFARNKGLKIVTMPFLETDYKVWYDFKFGDYKYWDGSPIDFISIIRNSEYVVTDSFHSTIFSCLYHKTFAVFPKKGQNQMTRLLDLMDLLDIENRVIDGKQDIDSLFEKKINWEHVDDKLGILREQSNNYLDGLLL